MAAADRTPGSTNTIDILREQLESYEKLDFVDLSGGLGEEYAFDGIRMGAGFADGRVAVLADGRVAVRIETGLVVPQELRRAARKLFRLYNDRFIVEGLKVAEDGTVVFEPEPVDLVTSRYSAARIAGCGMAVLHEYLGAATALVAGTEPWALMDYTSIEDGSDEGAASFARRHGRSDGWNRAEVATGYSNEPVRPKDEGNDSPDDFDPDRFAEFLDSLLSDEE